MAEVASIIGIVAGIVAIIGGFYKLYQWFKKRSRGSKTPTKIITKEGNIYGIYKGDKVTQLTFDGNDSTPLLVKSKKLVIFLRARKAFSSSSNREYAKFKIMTVSTSSLEERTLIDQKPFWDGQDRSFELLSPRNMMVSSDESKVLFVIEKYATGSEFVQVDIETGRFQELFSAEKVEVIRSGQFKDLLLIGVSEVGERGRDIYHKVSDWKGNYLMSFSDREEYMAFRSSALESED